MNIKPKKMHLITRKGRIPLPLYIPTTTFGKTFAIDDAVRPFLTPRITPAVMASYRFVHQMTQSQKPDPSFWLDSGAFALLCVQNATWRTEAGISLIQVRDGRKTAVLHPRAILDAQEQLAEVAFTLDIPIPVECEDSEADRRITASLENARWALKHRVRTDLPLFASVPVHTVESTKAIVEQIVTEGFDGIALGGLVPRRHQSELLMSLVKAVKEIAPDLPLHLFGMGKPETCTTLFEAGADSVDSSSWVRYAANGKQFGQPGAIETPSRREQQHLALMNLAIAQQSIHRSTATRMPVGTWFIRPEWFKQTPAPLENELGE